MSANERKTITGELVSVNATAGTVTIQDAGGHERTLRLMDARYWATGAGARAYRAALGLKRLTGKRVTAHAEDHQTFGWTIFGRRNIRLAGRRKR